MDWTGTGPVLEDGFVIVDCETTGLDPSRDAIIQVALLRWSPTQVSRLDYFVNPGRSVPETVQNLTGFRHFDFSQHPRIGLVREPIQDFIGDSSLVGHNLAFDLQFLQRAGIHLTADTIDTLQWAPIALPLATSYRLSDLVGTVELGQFHDARVDVEATLALVMKIRQRLGQLPSSLQKDLAFLLGTEWNWWQVPSAQSLGKEPEPREYGSSDSLPRWPHQFTSISWLGPQGPVAMRLPGFEPRPSQNAMVAAIEAAMKDDRILMVEAGTGTGKSLAYLTPAILHVAAEGQRTVVATHTLALQEQLWVKDLPLAMGDSPVLSAVLKGRGRYLCLLKLDEQKQDVTVLNSPRLERYGLAQIITFAFWSVSGDIDEFNPRTDVVRRLWNNVVAERHACAGSRCVFAGPCFLRQSKRLAEASHVVVVNHALLATHLKQGGVLPAFTHLIIDEAHHFAEVMERTLGMELDIFNFTREFEEMDQGRQGLLQRLPQHADIGPGIDAVRRNMRIATELLWQLNHELVLQFPNQAETRSSMRVTPELWDRWQGETLAQTLLKVCQTLDEAVHQAHDVLAQAEAIWGDAVHEEVLWLRYGKWLSDIFELAQQLEEWGRPNQDWVSWWEVSRQTPQLTIRLKRAPLDVGNFLNSHLWDGLPSGVVTSATLGIRGNFEYYQSRLGIPKTRLVTLSLPTPFDVPNMAQLLVPNDIPEVSHPDYVVAVSDFSLEAASALGGRTLVLFTSHRMMYEVNRAIRGPLLDRDIQLLVQGIDGTGPRLVEQFRGHPSAVLMGTASLWEGVDIPGPQLSLVIIVRLPFANPMDPMEEAIRERLGRFAFNQHTLPQALLRFKQGFGRLLRTTTDKGAVVVLDSRILPNRTQYGKRFVAILPDPPMVSASWTTIIQMIRKMSEPK